MGSTLEQASKQPASSLIRRMGKESPGIFRDTDALRWRLPVSSRGSSAFLLARDA